MESPYISGSVIDSVVGLIVVEVDKRLNAMTVSSFSELAHHPTSLWVSIAQSSYTHSLIEKSCQFSLVVLSAKQKDIAIACGTVSGRDQEKCARLRLYRSPQGFLFLDGAIATTACRVRDKLKVGNHTVFLANILEGDLDTRQSRRGHLMLSDL
ncbi:MAG: flavin reductase family protein [Candidatus Binatia bacterium]